MPKPLLILWVPRSGKSTLSKKVAHELNYNWIPIDPIIGAFGKSFPDLGIRHRNISYGDICANFADYFNDYLYELALEWDGFVVDCYHMRPLLLSDDILDRYNIVSLWYPGITVEEKFEYIRKYDNDWTTIESDEFMKQLVSRFIVESSLYRDDSNQLGLQFFDVSFDFKEVHDNAFSFIKNTFYP